MRSKNSYLFLFFKLLYVHILQKKSFQNSLKFLDYSLMISQENLINVFLLVEVVVLTLIPPPPLRCNLMLYRNAT